MNSFLTPEIITALGGSGGLVLVVMWFFLHMAKIQAEDTDKLADRLGKSQTEFKTFAESQMKLMATMNTEMAKVVLESTKATQELSKVLNKNNDLLTNLLHETKAVARSIRTTNEKQR